MLYILNGCVLLLLLPGTRPPGYPGTLVPGVLEDHWHPSLSRRSRHLYCGFEAQAGGDLATRKEGLPNAGRRLGASEISPSLTRQLLVVVLRYASH
eukprot:1122021-Rhodomonas_salina.1